MDQLLHVARSGIETIRKKLGPDDDWMPTLIVGKKDGGVDIVGIPPAGGSDAERALLWQSTVPSLLVERNAVAVVLVFTSWATNAPRSEVDRPRPSEDPRRREMLTLLHVTPTSEQVEMAEILRGTKHPRLRWEVDTDGVTALSGPVMAAIRRGLLS